MFAIIGGGRLSSYLNRLAIGKSISIRNFSSIDCPYGISSTYNTINDINKFSLDKKISNCIINWSITNPRTLKDLRKSIIGFNHIAEFISKHPKIKFLFISSTSASSGLLGMSNYGISKRIAEGIFMNLNSNRKDQYKIRILRPGLIYGLDKCPIKRIVNLYKYRIKLILGKTDSVFAVTSIRDLSAQIFDINSPSWKSQVLLNGFYEEKPHSLDLIYDECNKNFKHQTLSLCLNDNSILYKFIRRTGSKIDLSLASFDRYPSLRSINYQPLAMFENYLYNLCQNNNLFMT